MKRLILIILGVLILAEVVWAVWTLSGRAAGTRASAPKPTAVVLIPDKNSLRVGETVKIDINLSSTRSTSGADLVIIYDPNVLAVKNVGNPVSLGNLYPSYPSNLVSEGEGRVSVSAVTQENAGVIADGHFGSIEFMVKAAGQTQVMVDFAFGQTTDSNIIAVDSGDDILLKVTNASLSVLP